MKGCSFVNPSVIYRQLCPLKGKNDIISPTFVNTVYSTGDVPVFDSSRVSYYSKYVHITELIKEKQ
jgi:hypothetical protein